MKQPEAKWSTAWLIWLGYFLVVEIPAAIWVKGATLSENVWYRWFPTKKERWVLAAFLIVLAVPHFVYEAPATWSVIPGGIAVGVILIRSEIRHRKGSEGVSKMNHLLKKGIVSALYALGPAAAVWGAGGDWELIVGAFVPAFWGTFKSNTTIIGASRKGETITGPQ